MTEFSFARQPILDRSLRLYAYEFLYRPTTTQRTFSHSLTSDVLSSLIIDLGLEEASSNHIAFINMSYDDIMSEHIEALPADKFILELLEDIQPDEKLNKRVQALSDKGFSFALDDFVYAPEWDTLIELVDIIKLDLTLTTLKENKLLISKLKTKNIKFLAEKVETRQQYNDYLNIGCDFFQGYFFCKPEKISGSVISASVFAKTQLIANINQSDISIAALEKTIQQDPNLTYILIKYLNSAYFSFTNPIETIKQAIIILGIEGIKRWSTILCLRDISTKPSELIRLTLVRAKLAELLAIEKKLPNATSFFLMGLLSTIDALLDTSMEAALQTMPLNDDIINGLLHQDGEMGEILAVINQHEKQSLASGTPNISNNYLEACHWADKITSIT